MFDNPSLPITENKTHAYYMQAVSQASSKIIKVWRREGMAIQKELLFPNDKPNNRPYSVDGYFIDGHLMFEIDGVTHEKTIERDQKRDKHIEGIASGTGHKCYILRIPFIIPEYLIYGGLQNNKRRDVKIDYQVWLENWAMTELANIPNRLRLAQLKDENTN